MEIKEAEKFLKSKGVNTEKYLIHDINGGYNASIPIAEWLQEFAQQQVKENVILPTVMKSKDFADGLNKVIKDCADYDIDKSYVDDGIACCIDEGQTANQVAKYLYNYFS